MEIKGAALLYVLAGLMVTFAGFSSILLLLRQTAGAQISPLDRLLSKTVVGNLFMMTAGAVLPPLLALYDLPETLIWQVSALAFGLPMLALLLSFPSRRFKAAGTSAPPVVLAIFGLGAVSVIVMLACVFGGFEHQAAVYITALSINFFGLALAFIVALGVVVRQPLTFDKTSN
jgi:hypothetical protein